MVKKKRQKGPRAGRDNPKWRQRGKKGSIGAPKWGEPVRIYFALRSLAKKKGRGVRDKNGLRLIKEETNGVKGGGLGGDPPEKLGYERSCKTTDSAGKKSKKNGK